MRKVAIDTEYIKLGQLLKLADMVSHGSEAKLLIQEGLVCVNGQVVYERGKKVYPGDRVSISDPDLAGEVEVEGGKS